MGVKKFRKKFSILMVLMLLFNIGYVPQSFAAGEWGTISFSGPNTESVTDLSLGNTIKSNSGSIDTVIGDVQISSVSNIELEIFGTNQVGKDSSIAGEVKFINDSYNQNMICVADGGNITGGIVIQSVNGEKFSLRNLEVMNWMVAASGVSVVGVKRNSDNVSPAIDLGFFSSKTSVDIQSHTDELNNIDKVIITNDYPEDIGVFSITIGEPILSEGPATKYTVSYDGNGSTGGTVPADGSSPYEQGAPVTVLGNTGSLVKTGYTFEGWNTKADGSGDSYVADANFSMGTSNVTLYAQWTANSMYTVTYNGNTNTGGSVPTDATSYHNGDVATVLGNTGLLTKTGYTFTGWNTKADGSGTNYSGGDSFDIGSSNVTLYAKWTPIGYTVTYNGNTNTGGSVPIDGNTYNIIDTVTVLGNSGSLVKAGHSFAGWNTKADGSGTDYSSGNTFAMGSSNVTLYAKWTPIEYTVTYNGNTNTGGSVPTDATSYHNGATVTVLGNTGLLTKTGYTFEGWNTKSDGSGTDYSSGSTFTMGDSNVTLYAKWTLNSGGGSTGGGGGGTPTTPTNPTTPPGTKTEEKNVPVIINGKVENAGTETITQNNGIKNVDMSVSGELVNKKIEEAVQQQTQAPNAIVNNVVEVPISATDANSINTKLTGDIVKKMDDNSFKLMINAGNVDYIIPANELKIENVATQMGVSQTELKSIEVQIKIEKVTEETAKQISENAAKKNMSVVVSPVEFSIVANTVSKDGARSEVTISKFSQYVERVIDIPEGVDPSKITTGVVYNDDGSFAHIPTEIVLKDSKYYARLNSPTNSKYSVIWNPVKVASVKNHWSKDSVEDMASRLVIDNPNSFEPNRAITRGEFIDVVTKGLGIYRPQTEATNKFNDVNKESKYYNGVLTGVDYGLINGYKDGSFKPNQKITREEAMAIYAKAMDIAKLEASNKSKLKVYKDSSKISAWAYDSVDKVVASGIFSGRSASQISPKDNITCAEAVVAMRNLLVKGNLINE